MNARGIILLAAVAGIVQAEPTLSAAVAWPTTMAGWTKITIGGADYTDRLNQPPAPADKYWASPQDKIDIVGGLDSTGTSFTAGFWAVDSVNQMLMFRIRCDNPWAPTAGVDPNAVWTVLINSDGDDYADYALQLDHKTDHRVEIGATTNFGPTSTPQPWGNVGNLSLISQTAVGSIANYARSVDATNIATGDGSKFHNSNANDHDTFADIAIPLSQFELVTGLLPGGTFRVALATSTDHINLNGDKPDGGWSDLINVPVPEPTAMAAVGVIAMGLLQRKRKPW